MGMLRGFDKWLGPKTELRYEKIGEEPCDHTAEYFAEKKKTADVWGGGVTSLDPVAYCRGKPHEIWENVEYPLDISTRVDRKFRQLKIEDGSRKSAEKWERDHPTCPHCGHGDDEHDDW
jgi:hypothetical protein